MSNIYIQEPPTAGKVLLKTTAGDFDIELWSKEAPKACRNFVQLCLESYYDGTIFHRVVPGFIVQGGDPTGTGTGGESIYGKTFKDEFHSRLRFVRRGLVAMANAGPNDNGSQFFMTLNACKELQNKHTIFGKIAGDTIYNISRFEEGLIGENDRPEHPHKIMKTEVLNNPFSDIIPRVEIQNEIPKEGKSTKKGTKNFKLLSFGDEAEEDEEEFVTANKKMPKANSAHDIGKDPTLSSDIGNKKDDAGALERIKMKLKSSEAASDSPKENPVTPTSPLRESNKNMPEEDKESKRRSEIKAEIRKLKKELKDKPKMKDEREKTPPEDSPPPKKSKPSSALEIFLEESESLKSEREKIPKKGASREKETLGLLARFRNKIKRFHDDEDHESDIKVNENEDESWLHHKIQFEDSAPVLARDANVKDDTWYDINDPRNPHAKRRREESERKMNKPRSREGRTENVYRE